MVSRKVLCLAAIVALQLWADVGCFSFPMPNSSKLLHPLGQIPSAFPQKKINTLRRDFALQQTNGQSNEPPQKKSSNFLSSIGGDDEMFDIKTTFGLVGGQAVLVGIAVAVGAALKTPNFGLGPGVSLTVASFGQGALLTLPLAAFAWILDLVEDKIPALQDVTTATQRSVLALMGSTFKPVVGLIVAVALGVAAGLGEEMLFRGVLQYELLGRFGNIAAVSLSSIIFGLLHAVTPVYALLATLASFYFGYVYLDSGNLVVPIVTHALYDIGALMYAHWCVSRLSPKEQTALTQWEGPNSEKN